MTLPWLADARTGLTDAAVVIARAIKVNLQIKGAFTRLCLGERILVLACTVIVIDGGLALVVVFLSLIFGIYNLLNVSFVSRGLGCYLVGRPGR